uniref:Uncharacterized protein n=1 Tax=Bionectria ochroleuca TaxID=29856 RepID=A0A0B7JTA8_BIOOC
MRLTRFLSLWCDLAVRKSALYLVHGPDNFLGLLLEWTATRPHYILGSEHQNLRNQRHNVKI